MALTLSQLRKQYVGPDGSVVPVVDIENFHLNDAEQLALVGSSGSGKTTLLHLIAGILTPDSGRIVFDFSEAAVPYVKVNVKMGESSFVRVVAEAGGKYFTASKEVKVTIGGCGG